MAAPPPSAAQPKPGALPGMCCCCCRRRRRRRLPGGEREQPGRFRTLPAATLLQEGNLLASEDQEKIMKNLGTDFRQIRQQSLQRLSKMRCNLEEIQYIATNGDWDCMTGKAYSDTEMHSGHTLRTDSREFQITETPGKTSYLQFKSCIVKKLASQVPVASSPIATRWQQACARNQAEQTFVPYHPPECTSDNGSDPKRSIGKITTKSVPSKTLLETTSIEPFIIASNYLHERSQPKKQKCLQQMLITECNRHGISEKGGVRICEKGKCLWKGCKDGNKNESDVHPTTSHAKTILPLEPEIRFHITGLRNDYYLNVLDWSHENLIALAIGSVVYIWNGETNQIAERIDLGSRSKYIASVAWMKDHGYLAFGTSDGEVQLWDIKTKKAMRNMFGHKSVVGTMSWNGCVLSSGSRLGCIYHHDVRVVQHHIGMIQHSKQSVCSLQWSPDSKMLASGSSDGLLNIWPNDPGVPMGCRPLISVPHASAVKAMMWCPWESAVIATGGGMKDRLLHIWDISDGTSLGTADAKSQVCSLVWLPNSKEFVTGQGHPWNKMSLWKYSVLSKASEFCDHTGRVLHMALSPDGNRIFTAAADETAYVWRYRKV